MTRLVLAALLAASPIAGSQEQGKPAGLAPTLDLLPKGSTLTNIRIPRYDENRKPAALMRAALMKVVTKNFITANEVALTIYKPDGTRQLKVEMKSADYHVHDGILEAHEKLTLEGERFSATGKGAIFQLDSRRAFIHGPVTTSFLPPAKTSMRATPPLSPLHILFMGSMAMAAPEPLTDTELAELDELTTSSNQDFLAEAAPTTQLVTRAEQLAGLSEVGFRAFANEVGQPGLLTIATSAPATAQADTTPEPDPEGLQITCDGGMYVDAEKGHVVYLKNILVKEPRFTMKAGEELKIFLTRKATAPKTSTEKEDSPFPSFEGPADFSEIKSIVATGGVVVTKQDAKGGPARANADTATYDAKSGDIILRGGFPTVRQGKKYVRAQEPGLYIRIYANGNVYFQPGKWETFANTDELEKNR